MDAGFGYMVLRMLPLRCYNPVADWLVGRRKAVPAFVSNKKEDEEEVVYMDKEMVEVVQP